MFPIEIIPRLRDVSGLRYLERLERRTGPGMAMVVIQSWEKPVRDEINRQFEVGGDPRWKLNRPSTIEGKGHARVLFGRGGGSHIKDTIYVIFRATGVHGGSLFAGDRTSYGIFHQEGVKTTWLIPANATHASYRFKIGPRWVTIPTGRQIRHPGLPRRPYIVVGIRLSRQLANIVWEKIKGLT